MPSLPLLEQNDKAYGPPLLNYACKVPGMALIASAKDVERRAESKGKRFKFH